MCSWLMEELDEWGLLDEPRTKEVRRKVQHLIHGHLEDDDATPIHGWKSFKIFAQKCKNENTFVIFFHPQVIVVLGRLQELLTMVKLPKQVNSGSWNFSYELTRRWFLISFWKAELSAEMEKTESDLKTELVRCGRYISFFRSVHFLYIFQ